ARHPPCSAERRGSGSAPRSIVVGEARPTAAEVVRTLYSAGPIGLRSRPRPSPLLRYTFTSRLKRSMYSARFGLSFAQSTPWYVSSIVASFAYCWSAELYGTFVFVGASR